MDFVSISENLKAKFSIDKTNLQLYIEFSVNIQAWIIVANANIYWDIFIGFQIQGYELLCMEFFADSKSCNSHFFLQDK